MFATNASMHFGTKLRKEAFAKVTSLSLEQTDAFTAGSLVTRLTNDITAVQDLVSMALRMFVRTGMQLIGGLFMLLTLNVEFGVVFLAAIPIQILLLVILLKKTSPLYSVVQKNIDGVNNIVRENVAGTRVVKAYNMQEYEINKFLGANNTLTENTYRVQKIMASLTPFMMIIMNASMLIILGIGASSVNLGNMEVGDVMAAVTYVVQILMSVMMVGFMFQNVTRAKASAVRLAELLSVEPAVVDGDKEFPEDFDSITYKDVKFSYPAASDEYVLKDIDIVIPRGKTTAILGATGCGKSTLLKLLFRFYDLSDGAIYIGDTLLSEIEFDSLRKSIAFVLQKSELFSGTVRENIRWGDPNATDEEVEEAAKVAMADEFITKFREGYDTVVAEKGASLSGGQKQRISIARAILKNPKILIFDDATSALDLSTEAKLRANMKEKLKDTTVIMVAQRVASVMSADNIIVLDNGIVAASGTHKELLETSDIYRDIYTSQIKEEVQ